VATLLLSLASPLAAQQPPMPSADAIVAADSAAHAWFALLAVQGYEASWVEAGAPFKERIRREDWMVYADHFREQFVRAGQRTLVESWYRLLEPPMLEPGEYVTLRYRTVVSPERQVSETVLLIRDAAGTFRVADWVLWPGVNGDPVLDVPYYTGVRPPPRPTGPPVPPPQNIAAPKR
jgi:hypothetical protein